MKKRPLRSHDAGRVGCFSLLIGARSRSGRFTKEADKLIREITQRHFPDGSSILRAEGQWFDPEANEYVAEESRQILVRAKHVRVLRPWCEELGRALSQKELLVIELGRSIAFRFDA